MIENCPVCGKAFDVQYPHLWRYKRSKTFLCSYGCMRALDDKRGENRDMALTQEQRQQVISMLLKGENPNEYIRGCGIKNPNCTLWNMKKYLQKNDPETFRKVMDAKKPEVSLADAMAGMQDAADKFFGACEDMGLKVEPPTVKLDGAIRIETPEKNNVEVVERPRITKPVNYDGFEMSVIRSTNTGARYEFAEDCLFVKVGMDEFVLKPSDWRKLIDEIPKAAAVLGVEV